MSKQDWTTDRPTEPGEYWVALHPDQRERLYASQPLMCVVIARNEMVRCRSRGMQGFLSVRINDLLFDGAKWSRRETPADPFEEVVT